MDIQIPADAEAFVRSRAEAAGFASVGEYVVSLIQNEGGAKDRGAQSGAVEAMRQLRAEVPKMSDGEIVALVAEARERCPQ